MAMMFNPSAGLIAGSPAKTLPACPINILWSNDVLERDLYIETTTVTILAMDGRRRWLDIQKLVSSVKVSTDLRT